MKCNIPRRSSNWMWDYWRSESRFAYTVNVACMYRDTSLVQSGLDLNCVFVLGGEGKNVYWWLNRWKDWRKRRNWVPCRTTQWRANAEKYPFVCVRGGLRGRAWKMRYACELSAGVRSDISYEPDKSHRVYSNLTRRARIVHYPWSLQDAVLRLTSQTFCPTLCALRSFAYSKRPALR